MFGQFIKYKNTDVLLMDPCFSRLFDDDIDTELSPELLSNTYADGYYHVIKGNLNDMIERIDEIAVNPNQYSIGGIAVESGRIGVYDYQKAIAEYPWLKERIADKEVSSVLIKNFTGMIRSIYDAEEGNCGMVDGISDDRTHDFLVVSLPDETFDEEDDEA